MMELVCESDRQSLQSELITDYIRTTAAIEAEKPAHEAPEIMQRRNAAYQAGTIIAKSYVTLSEGDVTQGYRGLLQAKHLLTEHISGLNADPSSIVVDAALDVSINNFGLPTHYKEVMATHARANLTLRTAEALNEYLYRVEGTQDEIERAGTVGAIVELTALGVLSRAGDVLAMPALPHHDQGQVTKDNGNSNIDLTASWRRTQEVDTRQVQTKAGCLLLNKDRRPLTRVNEKYRNFYVERIARARTYEQHGILIVSGCCDLGLRFAYNEFDASHALVRESIGKATEQDINRLNKLTHHLKGLLSLPERIGNFLEEQGIGDTTPPIAPSVASA